VGIENIMEDSRGGGLGELKDWHNWTQIQLEAQRVGPGEQVRKYIESDMLFTVKQGKIRHLLTLKSKLNG
jgi:hypothetical protein